MNVDDWIDVNDQLPEKMGVYICATAGGGRWLYHYDPRKLMSSWYDYDEDFEPDVRYWMELPPVPNSLDKGRLSDERKAR